MQDISTKTYSQWVVINITNSSQKTVVVKNIRLKWGKFHKDDDKDSGIPVSDVQNTHILPGGEFRINSCGYKHSPSGTEGEFDIYKDGGEKVRHFYWNNPWGSRTNTWTLTERNDKYVVETSGANLNDGPLPLGYIKVNLFKEGP